MTAVLHIITGLGIGGAERMLVQVAGALQQRGMPQHVVNIGSRNDYYDELQTRGIAVTKLGIQSRLEGIAGLPRLTSLINRLQPQTVQGWMYHGNFFAALAHKLAPGRNSRKLYWNLRASNMDDARYGAIIRAGALLSRWPDAVIANSQAGMDHHISRGFRPRRMEILPNGVDTDLFRPDNATRMRMRSELAIAPDALVAIHIARVDPMKDHAGFLAVMGTLPNITGLLVGAGTVNLPCPPNVHALGQRRDVAALCACADIIVSTSAFGEGFSNVIAEGMSAGLIPVVTDVGDARAIVADTGHVVPPRDLHALREALTAEAAAPERQARGLRARARIEQHFTLAYAVQRYAALYTQPSAGSGT